MKKILLLSFFVFSILSGNQAQQLGVVEEVNSVGYKEFQGWSADAMVGMFLSVDLPFYYGIGGYPRYNFFAPRDYFSFSAGMPFNAGFDLLYGSNGSLIQLMADVPLTLDINLGSRATPYNESLFGIFLGGGLDYNFMHFSYNSISQNEHTFGPVVHGGFRWEINGKQTGVRIAYTRGFGGRSEEINGIIVEGNPGNRILAVSVLYGIL